MIVQKTALWEEDSQVQAAHTDLLWARSLQGDIFPPLWHGQHLFSQSQPRAGEETASCFVGEKKGEVDSTQLLKAWSNLHCCNSSSWDRQKKKYI